MFQHTMESCFATTVILLVEKINLWKPRMIFTLFVHMVSEGETFAGGL